jgi:hypothetical protein
MIASMTTSQFKEKKTPGAGTLNIFLMLLKKREKKSVPFLIHSKE